MNTISIDSLLITENEWFATEGLGSTIKKGANAVWNKIKQIGLVLLEKIKGLIQAIKNMRSSKTHKKQAVQGASEGRAQIKTIAKIRYKLMDELQSASRNSITHGREVIRYYTNTLTTSAQPAEKDANRIIKPIMADHARIKEILEKYPPVEGLSESDVESGNANVSVLDRTLTEDSAVLQAMQREAQELIQFCDMVNTEVTLTKEELPRLVSSVLHALQSCTVSLLSVIARAVSYTKWDMDEVNKGLRSL